MRQPWDQGYVEPAIGMGATALVWTDWFAFTVIEVSAQKKSVWVQRDRATLVDLEDGGRSQRYQFVRDPQGPKIKAQFHSSAGRWYGGPCSFHLGYRDEFRASLVIPPPGETLEFMDPYSGSHYERTSDGTDRETSKGSYDVKKRFADIPKIWRFDVAPELDNLLPVQSHWRTLGRL